MGWKDDWIFDWLTEQPEVDVSVYKIPETHKDICQGFFTDADISWIWNYAFRQQPVLL